MTFCCLNNDDIPNESVYPKGVCVCVTLISWRISKYFLLEILWLDNFSNI